MGARKFAWPGDKAAAVTLSFDDARPTQISNGLPILDAYGFKASFYVSLDAFDAHLDRWRQALADGHEIGNHSRSHPCSGNFAFARGNPLENLTLGEMERDIVAANAAIEARTGVPPTTFAYPCGQAFVGRGRKNSSYVPLVARYFKAGRGFRQESFNDPSFCDPAHLCGTEADGRSFEDLAGILDQAVRGNAWVILVMHDVDDASDQGIGCRVLEELCDLLHRRSDEFCVDTVANIAGHLGLG